MKLDESINTKIENLIRKLLTTDSIYTLIKDNYIDAIVLCVIVLILKVEDCFRTDSLNKILEIYIYSKSCNEDNSVFETLRLPIKAKSDFVDFFNNEFIRLINQENLLDTEYGNIENSIEYSNNLTPRFNTLNGMFFQDKNSSLQNADDLNLLDDSLINSNDKVHSIEEETLLSSRKKSSRDYDNLSYYTDFYRESAFSNNFMVYYPFTKFFSNSNRLGLVTTQLNQISFNSSIASIPTQSILSFSRPLMSTPKIDKLLLKENSREDSNYKKLFKDKLLSKSNPLFNLRERS